MFRKGRGLAKAGPRGCSIQPVALIRKGPNAATTVEGPVLRTVVRTASVQADTRLPQTEACMRMGEA